MKRTAPTARLALLLPVVLVAACGTAPIAAGPAGQETSASGAPRCGGQQYPFTALENRETGTAVVSVQVNADGSVASAELDRETSSAALDTAALSAVKRCKFAPQPGAGTRRAKLSVAYEFSGMGAYLPTGVVKIGVQSALQGG